MAADGFKVIRSLKDKVQASYDANSAGNVVPITIVSEVDFNARVVILAHRNGDLSERRALVRPRGRINTVCELGEVLILVYNSDDDSLYDGILVQVSGSFTYLIS